ncbi:MAG: hypothetical protein OIF50_10380 [Flavobacteriaceae bacterium]|nr:hypothetical protein [Flavobacteriaceae bacterium]
MSGNQGSMDSILDKAARAVEIIDSMEGFSKEERADIIKKLQKVIDATQKIHQETFEFDNDNAALHKVRNHLYELAPNALMLRLSPIYRYLEWQLGKKDAITQKVASINRKMRGVGTKSSANKSATTDKDKKGKKRKSPECSFGTRRRDLRRIIHVISKMGPTYRPENKDIHIPELLKLYNKCGDLNKKIDKHDHQLELLRDRRHSAFDVLKQHIIKLKLRIRYRFEYKSEEYQSIRVIRF